MDSDISNILPCLFLSRLQCSLDISKVKECLGLGCDGCVNHPTFDIGLKQLLTGALLLALGKEVSGHTSHRLVQIELPVHHGDMLVCCMEPAEVHTYLAAAARFAELGFCCAPLPF